jgi:hypothetical protein
MPKISKGGVTNRIIDPQYTAPPGTAPEAAIAVGTPSVGGEQPSPGTNSSASSGKPKRTTRATKSAKPTPSTAPSTTGHSSEPTTDGSTASSAGTSSAPDKK